MSYALAVTYRSKAGEEQAIEQSLAEMTALSRGEAGCLAYEAFRSREDSAVFFLYERYANEEAFKAHAATDYFEREIKGVVWPRLDSRERLLLEPLG